MPTLDWIGKRAVLHHHREIPFRLLTDDAALSAGDVGSGNLLVQGDNLLALKALLPYYAGRVKCAYIDPPYNTGNEGWTYNDAVNSPEIRDWLGKAVGAEAEDLSRHDKWLCMLYPRLQLLRELLTLDGALFVSIDDNEVAALRLLLDEIFGAHNFVTMICWHKRVSPANDAKYFSTDHDYIVVYARKKELWRPRRLQLSDSQRSNYMNPDGDPRGPWNSAAYTCAKTADERPNLYYPLTQPTTGAEVWPSRMRVWAYDRDSHAKHVEQGLLYWGKDGRAAKPRIKKFLSDARPVVPRSLWLHSEGGHNQEAKLELQDLLPDSSFSTPKPVRLVRRILEIATDPDSLVLDSFAGSGTTGHATWALNELDGGNRKFILIEMEPAVAREVARPRLVEVMARRARKGEDAPGSRSVGFRYCTLGQPLFDETGAVRSDVSFEQMAAHVFFAATGLPLPSVPRPASALLGIHHDTAVYLLFDRHETGAAPETPTVLDAESLRFLAPHPGPKIVFASACRVGEARLRHERITFRQVPYQLQGL